MKKSLLLFMGVFSSVLLFSQSQLHVFQDWEKTTGSQNFFYRNVTKIDPSGNVFVAGATMNGAGNYDILVAKYNSSGVQQWIRQIDGAAHYQDFATALFIDGSNNVYITGAISNDTSSLFTDMFIAKYNSGGTQQWIETYNGAGNANDCGTDILVNSAGNVCVCGSTMNASLNFDFVTIVYNSAGTLGWSQVYNSSSAMNDVPVQIQKSGNSLVISGGVQTGTTTYDWAVVRYSNVGVFQSATLSSGGTSGIEEVHAMVTDASGNIYLAGKAPTLSNGYDYDVIKLDSNLVIQWENTYDGADHLDDIANGIQVNASGDVYVTGSSKTPTAGTDYLTLKYDSSGSLIWTKTFNDTLNGNDEASAMVLDNSGNIYVTGSAKTPMNGLDYYTMKYDSSGNVKWDIYFDGSMHLDDMATNIAMDTVGNVVVTGESETAAGVYEYATVRYVEKNVIVPTDFSGEKNAGNFLYYENKGQLINMASSLIPEVRYYTNNTSPACYFKDDTLSMVYNHIDSIPSTSDTLQRIDLSFTNSNEHLRIYALDKEQSYLNYFLGHCPDGITEIHGNERLVVTELYKDIDLVYSSNSKGLKYYFVIKPGGNPDEIKLQYTGASSTNIASNTLKINGILDTLSFGRPFTYLLNISNDTIAGSGVYADWHNNTGNNYSFDTHGYDSTKVLIIEVDCGNGSSNTSSTNNLDESTFYGGAMQDVFYDVKTDPDGNVYTGGYSQSADFAVTPGVLQGTLAGNWNAVVVKFNPTTMDNSWATYYGGSGTDLAKGITTGPDGSKAGAYNVYVTGSTTSSDFPRLNNFQPNPGGAEDGFIFRLNETGTAKIFATTFGGAEDEFFDDIALDNIGNVYAVGRTFGGAGDTIPLYPQSGTTSWNSGQGIILKISNLGVEKWATQFGNSSYTEILGVTVDQSNNIFIAGGTKTGIVTTGGQFPTFRNGYSDAFITKFAASDNNIVWSTYFGGNGQDVAQRIAINSKGDVAIVGFTLTPTGGNFTTLSGDNTFGGGSNYGDGFLGVFSNSGTQLFGGYLGGNDDDRALAVCFDAADRLFITGGSKSTNTWVIPGTNATGTYNVTTNAGGVEDAFIASFDINYNQKWGTYFGGKDWDTGFGVSCAAADKLYLVGSTQSFGTGSTMTPLFPLHDYDPPLSYYQDEVNGNNTNIHGTDGYIARFDLADIPFVGINEILADNAMVNIYPNPGEGEFNVDINFSNNKKTLVIVVYDILGQLVYTETIKNPQQSIKRIIDLSYLSNGMYTVQIKADENIFNKKLIKN